MRRSPLGELALLFLRLGATAFGGPAAHIALLENEVVRRRKWLSGEDFLDLLGATNLIPGPNSTEMAIHIGYRRAGIRGLIVSGLCFIVPAASITLAFAYLYVTYGSVPTLAPFVAGLRSAVIPVILGAVVRLGRPMTKNRFMVVTGLAVMALSIIRFDEIALLFGAGIAGIAWSNRQRLRELLPLQYLVSMPVVLPALLEVSAQGRGPVELTSLGLFFLKIGSVLYGSGYVLVAFLQGGIVDARHWLTQNQLLDAIAVGQFTPGPVLTTATFIGYLIRGFPGALVATAGIFLPSFVFVLLSGPFIPRLRASPVMRGFLDGVNAAAIGLMIGVCFTLGASTLLTWKSWLLFIIAAVVLFRWKVSPAWIMVGAGIVGVLLSSAGL